MDETINIWDSFSSEELKRLREGIDNYDPVKANKRENAANAALGLDRKKTVFEGKGYNIFGVTKWVDSRDGKEYEYKSQVVLQVDKFNFKHKWYWIEITLNGLKYATVSLHSYKHQNMTKMRYLKEMHHFYMGRIFEHARYEYQVNPDVSFLDTAMPEIQRKAENDKRTKEEIEKQIRKREY